MARGFSWGVYFDDEGGEWSLQVDSDYLADADRGWIPVDLPAPSPFPRGWRPRRVIGLDELGATIYAISPTTSSAIWTLGVASFTFEANDGTTHSATIIGRESERRKPRPF